MVQAQVLALLEELQREQALALLFITHDLSVLTHTCRRLAVMYAGRIVEEGPSESVFTDPQHPYSRALAAAFPTIGDRVVADEPAGAWPATHPTRPRCPRGARSTCAARWPCPSARRSTSRCAMPEPAAARRVCTWEPRRV